MSIEDESDFLQDVLFLIFLEGKASGQLNADQSLRVFRWSKGIFAAHVTSRRGKPGIRERGLGQPGHAPNTGKGGPTTFGPSQDVKSKVGV